MSFTSSVSLLRCAASLHANATTESTKSSATSSRNASTAGSTRSSGTICDSSCRRDSRCSTRTLSLGFPADAALRCRGGRGAGHGRRSDAGRARRARRAVETARPGEELRRDACERRRRAERGGGGGRTGTDTTKTLAGAHLFAPRADGGGCGRHRGAGTREAEWREDPVPEKLGSRSRDARGLVSNWFSAFVGGCQLGAAHSEARRGTLRVAREPWRPRRRFAMRTKITRACAPVPSPARRSTAASTRTTAATAVLFPEFPIPRPG